MYAVVSFSHTTSRPIASTHQRMPHQDAAATDETRVLIVDDDESIGRMLARRLGAIGHRVTVMTDGEDALAKYAELAPDVVIVDLWMPKLNGMQILAELQARDPASSVILLSGNIDVRTTVDALRAGAEDVQTKPVDLELLRTAIDRGIQRSRQIRTTRVANTQLADPYGFFDDSPVMRRLLRTLERLSRSTVPTLIVGEAGTGKRIIAEMLHQLSPRASRTFVRIACADRRIRDPDQPFNGISVERSQLGDAALLETANGGTIFVDEVAELSQVEQRQLLVLLNGTTGAPDPASVRIIAGTAHNLGEAVRSERLLVDLYHRLAVLPLTVPALRTRGDGTIRNLATRIVVAQRYSLGRGPLRIAESALSLLTALEWPGNVTQLRAVLEEAFFLALDSEEMTTAHLRGVIERSGMSPPADDPAPDDQTLESVERRHIAQILVLTAGHRTDAARLLGITRTTLYKKMYEYGLDKVGSG